MMNIEREETESARIEIIKAVDSAETWSKKAKETAYFGTPIHLKKSLHDA